MLLTAQYFAVIAWDSTPRPASLRKPQPISKKILNKVILASHLLALVARRINADWQQKYGHGLDWLESFVEVGRFRGTCYQAANWRCVGQTRGRSRYDRDRTLSVPPKAVYLYRL